MTSRMDPELFRVLLLKRLRMPFSVNVRACRCGRLLDVLGHHRAACSRVGELGKRGFGTFSFHTTQTDDVWKWWPKGCVCSAGASLLWMSPSSTLHGDGTHRRKADVEDGVALKEASRSKEATYPELCRGDGRARLVVIAGEVGGRWSHETEGLLVFLACEKSKSSPRSLQGSVKVGWYRGWCCLFACSTAEGVICFLVEQRGSRGVKRSGAVCARGVDKGQVPSLVVGVF